jgi:hypothetical protein
VAVLVSTIADTSDDINDTLAVIVEDLSIFTRHAAIRAAKVARWAWTLGQIAVGGDHAKRKARARRGRIKRERAAERRRQAQEFTRLERERARTEAKPESNRNSNTPDPARTEQETAGQQPQPAPKSRNRNESPDPPLRAGARTHTRQETPMATGEAATYEEAVASFNSVIELCRLGLVAVESMAGGLEAKKIPVPDGLARVIDALGSAQIDLDNARNQFQQDQAPHVENASTLGDRSFYPGAA